MAYSTQITHNNHFVPQLYLKNWSDGKKHIWGYRLLVSNEKVPNWRKYAIDRVAYQRDLYTVFENGSEVDTFEKWLETEIEVPALESLNKVILGKTMGNKDWENLAGFYAAQDLRTPLSYIETRERWIKGGEEFLENSLRNALKKYEEMKIAGNILPQENFESKLLDDVVKIEVTKGEGTDNSQGYIKAEMPIGRKFWIRNQEFLLENTAEVLKKHKWCIAKPAKGLSWFTSDHPAIKLEYQSEQIYNFKGGWGEPKTDLFLPLSPQHLLFTEVGIELPDIIIFSHKKTIQFLRFISERAFRWIFSDQKHPLVEIFCPRKVDPVLFKQEQDQWKEWHSHQSESEFM